MSVGEEKLPLKALRQKELVLHTRFFSSANPFALFFSLGQEIKKNGHISIMLFGSPVKLVPDA
jgi:hypothetical protein